MATGTEYGCAKHGLSMIGRNSIGSFCLRCKQEWEAWMFPLVLSEKPKGGPFSPAGTRGYFTEAQARQLREVLQKALDYLREGGITWPLDD